MYHTFFTTSIDKSELSSNSSVGYVKYALFPSNNTFILGKKHYNQTNVNATYGPVAMVYDLPNGYLYVANLGMSANMGSISIIAFNNTSHEPFNYLWIIVAVIIIIAVLASVLVMRREKKKGGPKQWQLLSKEKTEEEKK